MKKLLLLTYFICAGIISSQTLYFEEISNNEGLPQSQVYDIIQDHRGYLWIGTGGGLARYDGFEIKSYNIKDGLTNTVIFSLYEDFENTLWIGTDKGVHLLKNDTISFGKFNNRLDIARITKITQDKDSTLWIGTEKGIEFHPKNPKLEKIFSSINDLIWDISFFEDGKVSIIHGETKCSIFDGSNLVRIEDYINIKPQNIFTQATTDSVLYIASADNLYEINGKNVKTYSKFIKEHDFAISNMATSPDGILWIGGASGNVLKFENGKATKLARKPAQWGYIIKLFVDSEYDLWMGTDGTGIIKYNRSPIINFTDKKKIGTRTVWDFAQSSDGKLYFSTDESGIKYLKDDKIFPLKFNKYDFSKSSVLSLYIDEKDAMWFGTYFSLYRYHNGKVEDFSYSPLIDNKIIARIIGLGEDHLLMIILGDGMVEYKDGKFTKIDTSSGLNDNDVYTIENGLNGEVWVTTKFGLSKYQDGKFTHYSEIEGLRYNNIISVITDSSGFLYLGSGGEGLFRIKLPLPDSGIITASKISSSDGLLDNEVLSLTKDNDGNLWAGTLRGVNKITWKDSLFDISTFQKLDGFLGIECNQNAIFYDEDNNVWVGTINGISKIASTSGTEDNYRPKIFLKTIKAETNRNPPNTINYKNFENPVKINYEHNNLKIEYSAISLKQPHKLRFQYKLEGFQSGWSEFTTSQKAIYTNLPSGDYVFRVTVGYENSRESFGEAHTIITIATPYYKTLWFNALMIVAVLGLFTLTAKLRENNLKRNKLILEDEVKERTSELADLVKSKDKLISIISHDLKSPFLSVLGSADLLSSDYDDLDDQDRKYLIKNLNTSLNNIYSLLENLLTWSRINIGKVVWSPESFNLRALIDEIIVICQNISHGKNIDIVNNIPDHYILHADRQMTYSIFYNLLVNALKFSYQNGNIIFEAIKNDTVITTSVSDTGKGMTDDELTKLFRSEESFTKRGTHDEKGTGLGFMIVKELVDQNRGEIWAKSEPDIGSTFYVRLPVTKSED